ncbi:DNA-binding domain-containing protein [Pseudomonas stutzeri]|uniref:HvfC/BufC N-terminal domain-containing protein n=1 Tax=Stutzerimonas stutzeri TaxID=316 RepID=UPI00210B523A|nr:DNA-binding domain-containing protein [Stutzerimonas stutzeri]MCQ4310848.1 DNA-binding domain-containing protein [Stutzerimonas stutzeri]
MSMSLGRFQDAFVDALQGVEPAAFDEADGLIATLTAQPGFAVYRNTVTKGCVDALRANFPTVERLVGAEWFTAAVAHYVRSSPPIRAQLIEYGADFADFLQAFEPARELPYLAGVARLDRLWIEAFSAAEQAPLTLDAFAAQAPETLAELHLRPCAATRWQWFALPVFTIWRCNREELDVPQPLIWQGEGGLMCRLAGRVVWQPLGAGGCAFLDACAARCRLDEASTLALQAQPDLDFNDLLARLFEAGVFAAEPSDLTSNGGD